ncbi:MAG: TonB-dependent receptor plug domain-containing protein [Prevotellaceae bacterium]|jgi:TonB-dependent SusC/RagA subfamily outer membrane receptor|nr:TonB-dependent receptor plug domain-containing protein [Prevotellaceae bacterium]
MKTLFVVVFSVCAITLLGQKTDVNQDINNGINLAGEKVLQQIKIFPQEKIHVHTDRSTYVAGEQIWYRAYLVDAVLNRPAYASRYVYVELISPAGELVRLDKIRPVDSLFHNSIDLPEDLPEGMYMIRAYTNFMRNRPDYFFEKKVFIADPQSAAIKIIPEFDIDDKRGSLRIGFHRYGSQEADVENLKMRVDTGKIKEIDIDKKKLPAKTSEEFSFKTIPGKRQTVYVEFESNGRLFKKYIPVPKSEKDFDVSFFPEGGYLIDSAHCKLAFKALKTNGLSEDVTGEIFDNNDNLITSVQSGHAGMGSFLIFPEKGKTYYAVFKNKSGESKRFQLPATKPDACVLKTNWSRSKLYITLLKGIKYVERPLYLVIHTKGLVVYANAWTDQNTLSIDKAMFPSGITQILLLDGDMNPLSERLVFCFNENELAKAEISTDKPDYKKRERVSAKVRVTDANNNPLEGDFSVSVTDNRDILPDSTFTIVSSLLLCSDIVGYIESPEHYLKSIASIDALLLTQGWKRYNVPAVLKDSFDKPVHYMEAGQEISGTVKRVLGSKVNADNSVSIFSLNASYADVSVSDENGRFYFNGFEFPDSTTYIVQALSKKGKSYVELLIDKETFPEVKQFAVPDFQPDSMLLRYIEKSDLKYTDENGIRATVLETVTITGQKVNEPQRSSTYSSMMSTFITSDKFERYTDLYQALMLVGGVMVVGDKISIRGSSTPPVIIIDDVIWEDVDLRDINIMDVESIEVLKGAEAAVLGSKGAGGAIILTTKRGDITPKKGAKFNIKIVRPKGYRKDVEFYSPKYEPDDQMTGIDRRTTIFWKPNVKISEGNAEFDFYTADSNSKYSVIIEGITGEGRIIRTAGSISRGDKQ